MIAKLLDLKRAVRRTVHLDAGRAFGILLRKKLLLSFTASNPRRNLKPLVDDISFNPLADDISPKPLVGDMNPKWRY